MMLSIDDAVSDPLVSVKAHVRSSEEQTSSSLRAGG